MDNCPKKDCHEPNALIFKKVVIPASVADDRVNPPKNGDYCNMLVEYEASGNVYIFSSDGIPTMISVDTGNIDYAELLNKPTINSVELVGDKSLEDLGITDAINDAVADEADIRSSADQEIWTEIEAIEAGSDVVDIVGTYAELQQYDISTLQNNDVIKVLTDETHDNAISYYRWNATTQAFTYVGSEGPYYTASETDTLLAAKQDKLIAGNNIQIAADGKTISATDTTYTHFAGATASTDGTQGLVPGPLAGDQDKFLKADGTWATVQAGTTITHVYYHNDDLYSDSSYTNSVDYNDVYAMFQSGGVIAHGFGNASLSELVVVGVDSQTHRLRLVDAYDSSDPSVYFLKYVNSQYAKWTRSKTVLQKKLTAGANVTINAMTDTISATDTTYSNFVGTDGTAPGAAGLVPAPAVADDNKYLKSDGTWATVQGGGSVDGTFYISSGLLYAGGQTGIVIYKDMAHTTPATYAEVFAAVKNGNCALSTGVIYDGHIEEQSIYVAVGGAYTDNEDEGSNNILFSDGSGVQYYLDAENGTDPGYPNITASFENQLGGTFYQQALHAGANISIGTVGGVDNTISVTGMPVLYGSQGQNTDGAVTQKVFTDTVGDVESILQILNSGAGV